MIAESSTLPAEDVVLVAQIVHEAIRAYQAALSEAAAEPWEDAEDWQREATLSGVGFVLEHPDAPACAQHEQWMADKLAQGWRYGAVKDAGRRTHPSLVPYTELPESERRKDALFRAVAIAVAATLKARAFVV